MNAKQKRERTPKLLHELTRLKSAQRAEIRRLYYQVADALPRLATALELADLDSVEGPAGALLDQHFACCEMLAAMKKLDLGKYL